MDTLGQLTLMKSGDKKAFAAEGRTFIVYFDTSQALGDNGRPVKGDVTGEFELYEQVGPDEVLDLGHITSVHVSPHGTGKHGNPHAKRAGAENLLRSMQQRLTGQIA